MPKTGITPKTSNYGSLTPRQAQVISAIRTIQSREGIPPSLDDIGTELGIDRSTVHQHIKLIKRQGYLTTREGKYRSIRLTAAASTIAEPVTL